MKYIEERDAIYIKKLRTELLPCLPKFCSEFFIGIAMNTTVLTRYNYATDLKIFFEFTTLYGSIFEGMNVTDITLKDLNLLEASDFEQFLAYIDQYFLEDGTMVRNKDRAKSRKFSAVRALFRYFYNKDKLERNNTLKVSMPKLREKEIIRLESDEVEEVFDVLESGDCFLSQKMNTYNNNNNKVRDNAIITLLLGTGIRVSECVGLDLKDIDFDNHSFLVVRKGGKRSILYFPDEVSECLQAYLTVREAQLVRNKIDPESLDAVFLSLQNKRISVRAVEIIVKKYTSIAAPLKNITPHKLRSTYGTALYKATNDIYVVAEVLGHSDINTTKKHYAAISDDIKKYASSKVKLRKDSTESPPTS